jgi:myo-inositol-1(or 4)-monophosphatase
MPDDLPSFLHKLSAAARSVTLGAAVPRADNKAGEGAYDPVTELDRAAELALRAAIEERFPEDGIEGEEFGLTRGNAPRRWVLDPVDGTRALICGLPSWTTLVALAEDGAPVAGFIDAPVLNELLVGLPGEARLNGRSVRTSGCKALADARLSTTDPYLLSDAERDAFTRLRLAAPVTRYGLDALAYARLAAGHIDLVAESGLRRHDWHALVPVVRGAGGTIGNWQGGADLSGGDVLAAATPDLFEAAVAKLSC